MSNEQREEQMMAEAEEYVDEVKATFTGSEEGKQQERLVAINDFCAGWRAADSRPNWIPVEESLPPIHYEGANSTDFVLIYDGDDVLIAYYDFKEKKWYNEQYGALIIPATHWMPMPQPPQGKEE